MIGWEWALQRRFLLSHSVAVGLKPRLKSVHLGEGVEIGVGWSCLLAGRRTHHFPLVAARFEHIRRLQEAHA